MASLSRTLRTDAAKPPQNEVHELLANLHEALVRRWWIPVLTTVLALAGAASYLFVTPKIYEARVSLLIQPITPQAMGGDFRDVVDGDVALWSNAREYLQTQCEVLRSTAFSERAAERLERSGGLSRAGRPLDRAEIAKTIHDAMSVEPAKESRTVTVRVRFGDPENAARIANEIAGSYTDLNLEERLGNNKSSREWLGKEVESRRAALQKSELALHEFKKANNLLSVSFEDSSNILSAEIKRLSEAATEAKTRRISVDARRKVLETMYARNMFDGSLLSLDPQDRPGAIEALKQSLAEENAKLLSLGGKYLRDHPTVVAQRARVDAIKTELRREVRAAHESAKAQYKLAVETERNLVEALETSKKQAIETNLKEIEYDRLKRAAESDAKMYGVLTTRHEESELAGRVDATNVRVLDDATPPREPVSPRWLTTILGALVLGLVFGCLIVCVIDLADGTVRSREDVEQGFGVPLLGLVPKMVASRPGPISAFRDPRSIAAESFRAVRTNLLHSGDAPPRRILVTSAGASEGKSMTSVNLASTLALSGHRVALVDGDMRRPSLHLAYGIRHDVGLSSVLLDAVKIETAVRRTTTPNLWVLTSGAEPSNPAELLQRARFKEVVDWLTQSFDFVVFDSPPVGIVTDAAIIASSIDTTVLVARSHQTPRELFASACDQLDEVRAPVLGCILNDVDLNHRRYRAYRSSYDRYVSSDRRGTQRARAQPITLNVPVRAASEPGTDNK